MHEQKQVREHLLELLRGGSAHIDLETAIKQFPVSAINTRLENSPHTAWELLEHIRIAQWDILDFSRNAHYKEMNFPDDYWPKEDGTEDNWRNSVRQLLDDLGSMCDLVADENTDLYAKIPHGTGQTILREALLIADHNAYHLGQLVLIKKSLV